MQNQGKPTWPFCIFFFKASFIVYNFVWRGVGEGVYLVLVFEMNYGHFSCAELLHDKCVCFKCDLT